MSFFEKLYQINDNTGRIPQTILARLNENFKVIEMTLLGNLTGENISEGSISDINISSSGTWNEAYNNSCTALVDAANAQEAADGLIQGFFQVGAPSIFDESTQTGDAKFGDIWIDITVEPPTIDDIYRCEDTNGGSIGVLGWCRAPTSAIGKIYLDAYNTQAELDGVKDNIVYKVEIISTNGNVFKNGQINTTLEARVYHGINDITDTIDANRFRWTRVSNDSISDADWNSAHFSGTKSILITPSDVYIRATFNCEIL